MPGDARLYKPAIPMLVQNRPYTSMPKAAKRNTQPTTAQAAWPRFPATVKRIARKPPIDVVGYRRIPSRRKPQRTLSATGDRQRVAQDQRASTAAAMHNGEMVKRKIGIDA